MIYFLVLAGMAKKVFKTGAFNHSAIPPLTILPDASELRFEPRIRWFFLDNFEGITPPRQALSVLLLLGYGHLHRPARHAA